MGKAAASTPFTDHLPRPHERAASDRRFIRPPPAGLDDLRGIRRSGNASSSPTNPETIGATAADYSVNGEGEADGQRRSKVKGGANLRLAKLEAIEGAGVRW